MDSGHAILHIRNPDALEAPGLGDFIGRALHLIAEGKIDATRIDGSNLPTSDPGVAGELWSDAGTVKVSSG